MYFSLKYDIMYSILSSTNFFIYFKEVIFMKLRRTIILIAWLGICLIAGYVTTLDCKPIYLTQDEVRYYTEIANIVWYEG